MRHTKLRKRSVALATLALSTVFIAGNGPASANPGAIGALMAPFSETGKYDAAPPATPQEAGELATAVSAVVTPEGNIVYWDGLSGLADSNVALPADAGRTGQEPDKSRLLILDDPNKAGWQLGTPIFLATTPDTNGGSTDNLFCGDNRLASTGAVVVAGGTDYETEAYADLPNEVADPSMGAPDGLAELYGSKNTRLYYDNGGGGNWDWEHKAGEASNVGTNDMAHGRWYPTLITLPSGKLFVASGVSKLIWNSNTLPGDAGARAQEPAPVNVKQTETYDPATDTWVENPEKAWREFPLFARMTMATNGQIAYLGAGQMYNPAGESVNEAQFGTPAFYDPDTQEWTVGPTDPILDPILHARSGAFQVTLPFVPNDDGAYTTTKVLIAGGTYGTSPGTYLAQKLTEIITLGEQADGSLSFTREQKADLQNARWYSSGVALPNGQVLAINGADKDEVIQPGSEQAVRMIELYDPESNTWSNLQTTLRDRTYHNSAVLLPDGSVLIGGHSPINWGYGGKGDNSTHNLGLTANNFRDPSFEIFTPPYLFNPDGTPATRPVLNPETANINDEDVLKFNMAPTNTITPTKVVLSKLPSTTHVTDADQRTVVLPGPLEQEGGGAWKIGVPTDRDVLPPGYYYVWVFGTDGAGEDTAPSVAQIVQIDAD